MKIVYKVEYALMPFPMPVRIPRSARILYVARQYHGVPENQVSIWFEIEAGFQRAEDDVRLVEVYGTGKMIPDNAVYLSTHILDGGDLVLHLYEHPTTLRAV
jgi:hypothetical protein